MTLAPFLFLILSTWVDRGEFRREDCRVTCDTCKTAIGRGETYSVTEFGRNHGRCLREVADPSQNVLGPLIPARRELRLERHSPIYVYQRQ